MQAKNLNENVSFQICVTNNWAKITKFGVHLVKYTPKFILMKTKMYNQQSRKMAQTV